MDAFLDGRPDRAWLSSIVGPTGSLVDLYRHAYCAGQHLLLRIQQDCSLRKFEVPKSRLCCKASPLYGSSSLRSANRHNKSECYS